MVLSFAIIVAMYGMLVLVKAQVPKIFDTKESSSKLVELMLFLSPLVVIGIVIATILTIFKLGYLEGRLKELN